MKKSQSGSLIIIFICWLAYLMSYLGRSDYSVCILDIVVCIFVDEFIVTILFCIL